MRAYAVDGSLKPLLWVSNRQWYSQEFKERSKRPAVDFVILDDPLWKISREGVIQVLGEPSREARFENTRVLIYGRLPKPPVYTDGSSLNLCAKRQLTESVSG